jgi:UDP-N-acetylglucosamine diphosphorylase/glucosamine-1-phosphate N-acetyltransferase
MPLRLNLNDVDTYLSLAPHTLTKPTAFLRCGILTNVERYQLLCAGISLGYQTADHLQEHFPALEEAITVDGRIIPNTSFIEVISSLKPNEFLTFEGKTLAQFGRPLTEVKYTGSPLVWLFHRWDLCKQNGKVLQADFAMITKNKESKPLPSSCSLIGDPSLLFIEEGAMVEGAMLNVKEGPIYIGHHAEVMEGTLIRGPFAMGSFAQLKMGSKIYGPTTLGPYCKVGGEVNNVIFESYTNKSHDGFLGNGYLSSWCNIGADTNASNLMNNYGIVDVYDYSLNKTVLSGEQFVGLHMGDHSKCGINTMFNTGTAVGVACNLFGPGFFKKHIPSFSFGEPNRLFPYRFEKALEGIESMMARRGLSLSDRELNILKHLFENRELF